MVFLDPHAAAAAAKSLQSCPTLCDPIDGSPPGSPVPGILQERTLEWVAISFSNAWKWKVKAKSLSHILLRATPWTAAYQALPSLGFSRQEQWSGLPLPSPSTIRYHLTMVEWLSSKSPQIINAREGVEKWKHSYNTGGNVNWKTVWRFLKKKPWKQINHMIWQFPPWYEKKWKWKSLSHVQLFVTPWTAACQAPLSMGFSRQEYLSGLLCPPSEDLPHPGIKPASLTSLLDWQVDSLPLGPRGRPVTKTKNSTLKRYMHLNAHRCTIYNSQDMEAI